MSWETKAYNGTKKFTCPVCMEQIDNIKVLSTDTIQTHFIDLDDSLWSGTMDSGDCPLCSTNLYSTLISITPSPSRCMHDGHPLGTGNKNSEFWIEWENIRWKNYPSNLKFKWKVQHHKEFNAVPFYAESLGIKKEENEKLEWVDFHHLPLFSFNPDMSPWEFVTWNICRGFLPSLMKAQFFH